jgi:hypothetical protein
MIAKNNYIYIIWDTKRIVKIIIVVLDILFDHDFLFDKFIKYYILFGNIFKKIAVTWNSDHPAPLIYYGWFYLSIIFMNEIYSLNLCGRWLNKVLLVIYIYILK